MAGMRYSVCASAVFGALPLAEAIKRIHNLGFSDYEFWSWWDQDLDAALEAQRRTGLRAAAMCTRFVPLNVPERRDEYLRGLRESIQAARRLDCGMLISQVGQAVDDQPRQAQHDAIVEGLRRCAPVLEDAGVTLVVEPLNALVDHKGYFLTHSAEAFEIIRAVNSPRVKVLFDVYHQQITEGNLIRNITDNIDQIGHVHIAGNPGRHEPLNASEVHYLTIVRALKSACYEGAVGLEYFPLRPPEEGLEDILRQMPL